MSNGGKGASAVVQIAYTYTAMGYNKTDEKLQGGIISGEQARLRKPWQSSILFRMFLSPKKVSIVPSWWC